MEISSSIDFGKIELVIETDNHVSVIHLESWEAEEIVKSLNSSLEALREHYRNQVK